ncbi:MAG: hypothetical protein KAX05_13125 [Bacteroidales bacterium]|nr:hypothetical protein [Bacteroidales bacterium]
MLEIIALIFITRRIGKISKEKGLNPLGYKILTIILLFACELIGGIIGILITEKTLGIYFLAIIGAIIGIIISFAIVSIPKTVVVIDSLLFYGLLLILIGLINIANISINKENIPFIGLIICTIGIINLLISSKTISYFKYIYLLNSVVLIISAILWIYYSLDYLVVLILDLFVILFGVEQLNCFLKKKFFFFIDLKTIN